MDQHFLWKSQRPEETYAAPAHDALLRDRFDSSQLRLDPNTIKHGLSSEGGRNHPSGLNKPMGNMEHLGDISRSLPLQPNMDRGTGVGSTLGNQGLSAAHSAGISVQTPAEGAPTSTNVIGAPDNSTLGNVTTGIMAPGNVVKIPGSTPSEAPEVSKVSEVSEVSEGTRRVVSTKRAAQNRNSQNAFRKRRQKYIEELESAAEKVKVMEKTIDDLRSENMELREFSLALQTRLMELERESTT